MEQLPNEPQLLPTPEIGLPVQWIPDDMNPTDCVAAFCTKIEAPGRIGVAVYSHNHTVAYKSGVHWVGDERRLSPERPFKRNGCWDFVPSIKPRQALKYHQDLLIKQHAAQAAQIAENKRLQEERARFAEEKRRSIAEAK